MNKKSLLKKMSIVVASAAMMVTALPLQKKAEAAAMDFVLCVEKNPGQKGKRAIF